MATWIVHMRIANYFMKKYNILDNSQFLVGNIAPDCGVPSEDWSYYTPSKTITHWEREDGSMDAADFKEQYIKEKTDSKYPFYLGYYFHLLTDIEWMKLYERKKQEPVFIQAAMQDQGIVGKVKRDWYGQDSLYLQTHPEFIFFTMFSKIDTFENIYFEFYPQNAFIRQIKHITEFYLSAEEDPDREFPFLKTSEMDQFVEQTITLIEDIYSSMNPESVR